jgi:hypothetical protein
MATEIDCNNIFPSGRGEQLVWTQCRTSLTELLPQNTTRFISCPHFSQHWENDLFQFVNNDDEQHRSNDAYEWRHHTSASLPPGCCTPFTATVMWECWILCNILNMVIWLIHDHSWCSMNSVQPSLSLERILWYCNPSECNRCSPSLSNACWVNSSRPL